MSFLPGGTGGGGEDVAKGDCEKGAVGEVRWDGEVTESVAGEDVDVGEVRLDGLTPALERGGWTLTEVTEQTTQRDDNTLGCLACIAKTRQTRHTRPLEKN